MREGLKLEDCISVPSIELYVSQKRKITSMVVKNERLITDVITCFFLNRTSFFSIMEMRLCGTDVIPSSPMAHLWINCLKKKLLGNKYHQNDVADIGYFGLRELKQFV